MKRFVDDMAVEVMESVLVAGILNILDPSIVSDMTEEEVTKIASESESDRTARVSLSNQLKVLSKGEAICKAFALLYHEGRS